jgi:CRISPR-associated protein (TIGR03986 family)
MPNQNNDRNYQGQRFNNGPRGGGYQGGGQHHGRPQQEPPETYLPSPYNFVPLAGKVFFPPWANFKQSAKPAVAAGAQSAQRPPTEDNKQSSARFSMDVPFNEAICGHLDIRVTAMTPIYIRNGGDHPREIEKRNADPSYQDFFRVFPGGPYAIPGSSFKGMLRSVIEIITFGKIAGSRSAQARVANRHYSVRDLQNRNLYGWHMTSGNNPFRPNVKAGWLSQSNGQWFLTPCEFARIEQKDLEGFSGGKAPIGRQATGREKEKESVDKKYGAWAGAKLPLSGNFIIENVIFAHPHSRDNRGAIKHLVYRKAWIGSCPTSHPNPVSTKQGTLVFTGQPSPRELGRSGRKHMEFVFFDKKDKPMQPLDKVAREIFQQVNTDENDQPLEAWRYWQPKLNRGEEIPVFYLGAPAHPDSMGLAMMYRLPYTHDIHQAIEHSHADHLDGNQLDFAEALFGRAEDKDALRGRVAVEALVEASGKLHEAPNIKERSAQSAVLGAPKPTFYPNYIHQPDAKDGRLPYDASYSTLMDKDCELRGWKRYPVRSDHATTQTSNLPVNTAGETNQKVGTRFKPLPADTVFEGRIHFHNIRPEELGAVVWALTWGGAVNLRHSLGMAKPLGFGSIKVEINRTEKDLATLSGSEVEPKACMDKFITLMKGWDKTWHATPQLCALLRMAGPQGPPPGKLEYPVLNLSRNDFAIYKKNKMVLRSYLEKSDTSETS